MRIPLIHDNTDATGKRVLVTGASGTFGKAIAADFIARGATVVGLDLKPSPNDKIPVIACDITDNQSVIDGVAQALDMLGGLDILINNAGTGGPAPAEFMPDAELYRQLEINLIGAWRVTSQCVDALVESNGRVVMVASRMAVMQLPLAAAYGVSKRAMVAYADALRLELAGHVGVTTVYPSAVRSPIHDSTKDAGLSLEGMSTYEPLEGVVAAIANAALSRHVRRDVPTSTKGHLEFFLARHLPFVVDRIVTKTLLERARSGAFDTATLARGVVARAKIAA